MGKKQLIIMCGVAGSGKDTWIKNHINFFTSKGTIGVVSRDEIRFSLLKDGEDYFAHETEVYNNYIGHLKTSLEHNDVTIANATHLNGGSRGKLLRALSSVLKNKNIEVCAMVIRKDLNTCLSQNENREGLARVPAEQIKRMYSNFTIPTINEGFDTIYIYKIEEDVPRYSIIQKGVD